MEFRNYQHIERFGTTEVEGIEFGRCYIFPKIDGTNASTWMNFDIIHAGSRKRSLSLESDNAGFYNWIITQENIADYLLKNPTHRLFGEWLVPHSLKTYRDDAWRKFYVFDVAIDKEPDEILHEGDDVVKYIPYDEYKPLLEEFGIEYIAPIAIINNPDYEKLVTQLDKNDYLITDGRGIGEGIVIKNYDFKNKYGRQTWAKIVTSEFKEKHRKEMGATETDGKKMVEEEIANEFVTEALCEKVLAKIILDSDGFTSRKIPQLLNTVYYDLIVEESWNFVKKHKYPTINFGTLKHFCFAKTKQNLPKIFGE